MMMNPLRSLVYWGLAAAMAFGGCRKGGDGTGSQEENPPSSSKKRYAIACVPKATTHSYWKAARNGVERAGRELNVNVEWQGPLDDSKVADQIGIFNNLAASGVDGILLSPCDDKALLPQVRNATRRGVPVAIFDSPLDGQQGKDFIGLVATDNRKGGQTAAGTLARVIGDHPAYGGKVLMMRFTEGSASTRMREEGFTGGLAADGKLSIVAQQYTDGSLAGAQRVAETLLGNYVKDGQLQLDGIFASNEPTAEGTYNALKALRDQGVQIHTRFVGFDDSTLLRQGLGNGLITALVVQDQEMMGYLGVRMLVDYLDKKPVQPYVDTGVTVKTRDDLR